VSGLSVGTARHIDHLGDLAALVGVLVRARRLSVATMRNIRQNLTFAFLYNSAGVPIAAGDGTIKNPVLTAGFCGSVWAKGLSRASI
jgi:cation transport ATPase